MPPTHETQAPRSDQLGQTLAASPEILAQTVEQELRISPKAPLAEAQRQGEPPQSLEALVRDGNAWYSVVRVNLGDEKLRYVTSLKAGDNGEKWVDKIRPSGMLADLPGSEAGQRISVATYMQDFRVIDEGSKGVEVFTAQPAEEVTPPEEPKPASIMMRAARRIRRDAKPTKPTPPAPTIEETLQAADWQVPEEAIVQLLERQAAPQTLRHWLDEHQATEQFQHLEQHKAAEKREHARRYESNAPVTAQVLAAEPPHTSPPTPNQQGVALLQLFISLAEPGGLFLRMSPAAALFRGPGNLIQQSDT